MSTASTADPAPRTGALRSRRKKLGLLLVLLLICAGGVTAALLWPEPPHDGLFLDPEGLAIGPDGRVYVADEDRAQLIVLDPEGKVLQIINKMEGLKGVTGGDSMIALPGRRVIAIRWDDLLDLSFAKPGPPKLLGIIGGKGTELGKFHDPEGICWDGEQTFYVTDEDNRRVQAFDLSGNPLRAWSVPHDPEGICFAYGRIYVTFSKADWVGAYDPEGEEILRFGEKGDDLGEINNPDAICLGPDGLLYVTDQKNNRIQVFDKDGAAQRFFGGKGREPGEFRDPEDLAFDAKGRLWVADGGNHRVQVLTKEGAVIKVIE